MARPTKATVDYFPHDTKHGKTIFILKSKYGNDGYAAWFQILEILGHTEGHQFDCSSPENQEYLSAYLLVDWQKCCNILDTLSKLGAIDANLWSQKLIWSDNFMSRISEAYKKRTALPPDKPQLKAISGDGNSISGDGNPQSKVKKIKEKEILDQFEPVWSSYPNKQGKQKSLAKWIKAKPSQETIDKILAWIVEEKRLRIVYVSEWWPNWKNFETWFNNKCWNDPHYNEGQQWGQQPLSSESLNTCKSCGKYYPSTLSKCPQCK